MKDQTISVKLRFVKNWNNGESAKIALHENYQMYGIQ